MAETKITKVKTNEAGFFVKRVGSTYYRVRVHFSDSSTETAQEKIVRIIKNEINFGKAVNQ